jgi:hypothetical protein
MRPREATIIHTNKTASHTEAYVTRSVVHAGIPRVSFIKGVRLYGVQGKRSNPHIDCRLLSLVVASFKLFYLKALYGDSSCHLPLHLTLIYFRELIMHKSMLRRKREQVLRTS